MIDRVEEYRFYSNPGDLQHMKVSAIARRLKAFDKAKKQEMQFRVRLATGGRL